MLAEDRKNWRQAGAGTKQGLLGAFDISQLGPSHQGVYYETVWSKPRLGSKASLAFILVLKITG